MADLRGHVAEQLICAECGWALILKYSKKYGHFYGCAKWPECNGTHGCHPGTTKPLGTPANRETKEWRIRAHDALDRLWKSNPEGTRLMNRRKAYRWLRKEMSLEPDDCHIGRFDIEQCQQVVAAVERLFGFENLMRRNKEHGVIQHPSEANGDVEKINMTPGGSTDPEDVERWKDFCRSLNA